MNRALLARRLHKWLALIVGIQALMWVTSGFYMVVVDLDFIHGDPLVRNLTTAPATTSAWTSVNELAARYPAIQEIRIKGLPGFAAPVYEVVTPTGPILVDGTNGAQLSPLTREQISALARAYYAGSGGLSKLNLLTADPPLEIQTRPLPLWRADFDDWLSTSLYVHPATGELVTRRHRFWRWFDFFWMLHIMDYKERENINNTLLRVATGVGVLLAASGIWLLVHSFRRRTRVPG
jgi:uncharacterized iron-regulated membrane protein